VYFTRPKIIVGLFYLRFVVCLSVLPYVCAAKRQQSLNSTYIGLTVTSRLSFQLTCLRSLHCCRHRVATESVISFIPYSTKHSLVVGRIEGMRGRLVRPIIADVCANTSGRIGVRLGLETLGDHRNIALDESPDFPLIRCGLRPITLTICAVSYNGVDTVLRLWGSCMGCPEFGWCEQRL